MRKGQAALEFLTTYGWAFLVILVMIGALAYFGVLRPSNLLPPKCTFGPEIGCVEFQLTAASGILNFRVKNNVGESAEFTFNATAMVGSYPSVMCTKVDSLAAGRVTEITCTGFAGTTFAIGDRPKFDIKATYKTASGNYNNTVRGEIQAEAK